MGSPVAIPFVANSRLLVARGMTGATGNIYCGLHEFEEMGFVLHALCPEDLFVDAGANVGSYTVIAAKVCGARVLAFEPIASTMNALNDNIRLNDISDLVETRQLALGEKVGTLTFSSCWLS